MTSVTPTRRIQISFEDGQDNRRSTFTGFFHTFSAYGIVEQMELRRDIHYGLCEVEVQYEKLSAADQLYHDSMRTAEGKWTLKFLPPSQCAGSTLLLSSVDPFPANFLEVLAKRLGQQQQQQETGRPHHVGGEESPVEGPPSSKRSEWCVGNMRWEEKLLEAPDGAPHSVDRGYPLHRGAGGRPGPAPVFRNVWELMQQAVNIVQLHSAGSYVGLLHFNEPYSAHKFLLEHQRHLSSPSVPSSSSGDASAVPHSRIIAMYSGAGATAESSTALHLAASRLLQRHRAEDLQVGAVLRGFVLRKQQEYTICIVEAGVRHTPPPDSGTGSVSQWSVLISTNAKVLRVGIGDEVDVQLTALQRGRGMTRAGSAPLSAGGAATHGGLPRTGGAGGSGAGAMWSGTLLKVVTEAVEACRNAPAALARRRRGEYSASSSHPVMAATMNTTTTTTSTNITKNISTNHNVTHIDTSKASLAPPTPLNSLSTVLSQLKSAVSTSKSSEDDPGSNLTTTTSTNTRSLASQLLRRAQETAALTPTQITGVLQPSSSSSASGATDTVPGAPPVRCARPPPHLLQPVHAGRHDEEEEGDGGVERLYPYAPPFHLHAKLVVEVTRVTPEGIVARLVSVDDVTSLQISAIGVWIPATFIPSWSSRAEERQRIAVEGERHTAALLYLVAVGGSAATRRCIASLRETDVNRSRGRLASIQSGPSSSFSTGVVVAGLERDMTAPGPDAVMSIGRLAEGTTIKGTVVLLLTAESIGLRGLRGRYGAVLPAYLVRPTLQAPAAAHQIPLLLSQQDAVAAFGAARLASEITCSSLIEVVVFSVSRSASRGSFAVVTTAEAYAQQAQWHLEAAAREQQLAAERVAASSTELDPKVLAIKNAIANAVKATRERGEEKKEGEAHSQRKRSKQE